ncbi:MAG: diphosphomevalonate decarboxylase [Saprospiraceae bacterium]|nr:diphosphomevalonate decarboxylase [Saprospiraceae bacterium]
MSIKTQWISPSNIAIVKYWGKLPDQIPMNPSLSLTLSESHTNTSVHWLKRTPDEQKRFQFLFEGKPKPGFEPKILSFLDKLDIYLPWLKDWHLEINSANTFPHSSGIASSASAMSALALCIVSFEQHLFPDSFISDSQFFRRGSWFARLGSGSASRSVFPVASLWGNFLQQHDSSDEFGIGMADEVHVEFKNYCDYIFIVSGGVKSVSSSAGHDLMNRHFFREGRIEQAFHHLKELLPALKTGDLEKFIQICETEAMTLHGLMMSSNPYYLLLQPDSLRIIHAIRNFRNETKIPLAFTIDAGPNIHLLFPQRYQEEIESWIESSLPEYLAEGKLIRDLVGTGPVCLS